MKDNLAVKALNQYRKRDIIPYLGLRYYLESRCGRDSRWINEVSCKLFQDSEDTAYLKVFHFKDFSDETFQHRDIYLPAPNEALSEIALITALSKYSEFHSKKYVYSYRFSNEGDDSGVFQSYFNGFKERHLSIALACKKIKFGQVFYTDIKKFYPSIKAKDALAVWERVCNQSGIDSKYRTIGKKILKNHHKVCNRDDTGKGVLTGPLFSHVIANLLLDEIDIKMNDITNGHYWRYVDDVVFVGDQDEITTWRTELESCFSELGLELHNGDKDFIVSCDEWLEGENDFENSLDIGWVSLIADVKRFLLANPEQTNDLKACFEQNHIRIPVIDYSNAVKESSYLQRFQDWRKKYKWATKAVKKIDIDFLLKKAIECEKHYTLQINDILDKDFPETIYGKKRLTPKLRYLAGRLLYLLGEGDLINLSEKLNEIPDLFLISKTMKAVGTKDVTDILKMGVNATHITAQLLRAGSLEVIADPNYSIEDEIIEQSIAILNFNGIQCNINSKRSELNQLAQMDDIKALMNSKNAFTKEFACLHGAILPKHQKTLDSGFDRNEELALDVLNQLQQSSHC